jgi:hypothetical protein
VNICIRCEGVNNSRYKTCDVCREEVNQYRRSKRAKNAAAGLCETCGASPPKPGRRSCRECLHVIISRKLRQILARCRRSGPISKNAIN